MSTIIVSAFLINVNEKTDSQIKTYIENGKKLLSTPIDKIIYIDKSLSDEFKEYKNDKYTQIIFVDKKLFYLYDYIDQITEFKIESDFPTKDTLEYLMLMCHKTEYMRYSIELRGKEYQYIWLDFGINHVVSCDDEEFIDKILSLNEKKYNKIRIGSIWDITFINFYNNDPKLWLFSAFEGQLYYVHNMYEKICWKFSGGVFGGNSIFLIKFADMVKEKCLEIISERKTLTWEVNIWAMIYKDHPELFDLYICDHNNTIIDNY